MLNLPHNGIAPDMLGEVRPLLGVVGLDKARGELSTTEVSDAIGRYIVALGRRTRDMPGVELGISSRAMIHLMSASKANARLNGRHVVTVEDVREMAPFVMRHRLILKPGAEANEVLAQVIAAGAGDPRRPRSSGPALSARPGAAILFLGSQPRRRGAVALIVEAPYENLIDLRERAKREVSKVVIGQDRAVELLLVAALARGHVLLEGPPGSAKTLLGRAAAHMLGASFKRIQFTPDTTPGELTGEVHDPSRRADSPARRRLHERAARGRDQPHAAAHAGRAARGDAGAAGHRSRARRHRLPDPFLVIATQNPYEHRDVFELPESQLDRFLFKIAIDYSDARSEYLMIDLPHKGVAPGHARRGAAAARRRRPRQGADRARLDRHPRARSACTWSRSRAPRASCRASSSA